MGKVKHGIYKTIANRVREAKVEGKLVVKMDDIAAPVEGLEDLDRAELEDRLLKQYAYNALNWYGYRSVIRGSQMYLDFIKCDDPILLERLLQNASLSVEQKAEVAKTIKQLRDDSIDRNPEYAQIKFDEDGNLFDELTTNKVIELMERLA